jgi:hypothetical protein
VRSIAIFLFDFVIVFILVHTSLLDQAFAASPTFSHIEIKDVFHDGLEVNVIRNNFTEDNYMDPLDNSTDIRSVDYSSDGIILNATLWLSKPIGQDYNLSQEADILIYGILIDADSNQATGKNGVEYQVEVQWNNLTKTWIRFFTQYSSDGFSRIIELDLSYTEPFREQESNYVLLYADLSAMNFPNNYKVISYSEVIYDDYYPSNVSIDFDSWTYVPSPVYTASTTPPGVELRQGDEEDIGLQIKSNIGSTPKVVNYLPVNYSGIEVIFDPDELHKPYYDTSPAPFRLNVPSDAAVGQYTIPLIANVSVESTFPSAFFGLSGFNLPTQGYTTTIVNFSTTIMEKPSIQEEFEDFWTTFGDPISLVAGGFVAGFTAIVFDRIKNRKKDKPQKTG